MKVSPEPAADAQPAKAGIIIKTRTQARRDRHAADGDIERIIVASIEASSLSTGRYRRLQLEDILYLFLHIFQAAYSRCGLARATIAIDPGPIPYPAAFARVIFLIAACSCETSSRPVSPPSPEMSLRKITVRESI